MFAMWKHFLLGAVVFCAGAWAADDAQIARGRFLVDEIGKCGDCHTPRTETGELDKAQWLKGATLPFQPINPIPDWHKAAPDLTSGSRLFERWKEEGLVKFMMTGLNPRGGKAGPPMPVYKLPKEDAEAIVAYLKTLK